jgi:MoxR-like ATPase
MFNIFVDYPSFQEEVQIVKSTTSDKKEKIEKVLSAEEILQIQDLIRRVPVTDHVVEYAVRIASQTRPMEANAPEMVKKYLSWGAGPRASQYLILGAKAHAAIRGKYSPDEEDVRAVAPDVLRHRIVRNYKAEAEGIKEIDIIRSLF